MANESDGLPGFDIANGVFDGLDNSVLGDFTKEIRSSILDITRAVNIGKYDTTFVESGIQFPMGKTGTASVDHTASTQLYAKTLATTTQQPMSSVLIKKRVFANLKNMSDILYLDSLERSVLRITKRLFQLKAFQIASYESLLKFEKVLQKEQKLHIPYLWNAINNASSFGAISKSEKKVLNSSLFKIFKRNLASEDVNTTTWYVNQFSKDVQNVGQGVGVMEFTTFTSFSAQSRLSAELGTANVNFEDPYNIMMISDDDIELAITNIIYGRVNDIVTTNLLVNTLAENLKSAKDSIDPVAQASARAAERGAKNIALDTLRPGRFDSPKDISLIRKKLRKLYLGKSVIQPTDSIYMFVKSNTIRDEDRDPIGPSIGLDKQGLDENILRQEMADVLGNSTNADIELYRSLRDADALTGTCVFSGVVESVSSSFADGFYKLRVSAINNMWFLARSNVNKDPALDQKAVGALYENLTPFNLEFDSLGNVVAEKKTLLQDNIDTLRSINVRYVSGPKKGEQASEQNILSGVAAGTNIPQVEHFPGMKYRFKEGISSVGSPFSATSGVNTDISRDSANNIYGLSVTTSPFDTMDAANIISLLITGKPYNPQTFADGMISTEGRLDTLMRVVGENNKSLGNFKLIRSDNYNPFDSKLLSAQKRNLRDLDGKINELESLRLNINSRLLELDKVSNSTLSGNYSDILVKTKAGLEQQLIEVEKQIELLSNSFDNAQQEDLDALGFSTDPEERKQQLLDYQNKQIYLANRKIEDVRFNRDKNYLVIGSEYEADLDVRAFVAGLRSGGFSYFSSKFDDVHTTVKQVANAIGFELFCDQSGNIVFRAPRYNKIPLSVYFELFRRSGESGVELIPAFIRNMFQAQLTSLRNAAIALNWEILIEIGKAGQSNIVEILSKYVRAQNQSSSSILEFFGYDTKSKEITLKDGDYTSELIEFFSKDQIKMSKEIAENRNTTAAPIPANMLVAIIKKYNNYFGANINTEEIDILSPSEDGAERKRKQLLDKLKELITKRNQVVKKINAQLSTMSISPEELRVESDQAELGSMGIKLDQVITEKSKNKTKQLHQEILQSVVSSKFQGYARPQISPEFSSIVEDDTRNYLGRGSGRRFIISDDMIKSMEISEKKPNYCKVEITGNIQFAGSLNTQLEQKVFWAGAVDYDLWQQYGFAQEQSENLPYLFDSESQLRLYAVFQLLKQRKKVLSGSITVVGNEYYQLGDVIYVPTRDLLFYVTGISQDFSNEGSEFKTILTIEYGRPPGEYIPTPLDIIGKTLLKQGTSSLALTKRSNYYDNSYVALASLALNQFVGPMQEQDSSSRNMKMMLSIEQNFDALINTLVTSNMEFSSKNLKLVITAFKNSQSDNTMLEQNLDVVFDWFTAPTGLDENGNLVPLNQVATFQKLAKIPADKIILQYINIEESDKEKKRVIRRASQDVITKRLNEEAAAIQASQESKSMADEQGYKNIIEIGLWYIQ